ncbi:MAG TPA: hypothetical protein VGG39_26835 [Polyangiaceae bacterium]|jgi:hypothetical protein
MSAAIAPDRPTLERQVADDEAALADAREKIKTADEQFTHAKEKHSELRTAASRRAVSDAKVDLEVAGDDLQKATGRLATTKLRLEELERSGDIESLTRSIADVQASGKRLVEEHAPQLAALERQIDEVIVAIARDVSAATERFNEGERIAEKRGLLAQFDRQCSRPSIATARLVVAKACTAARTAEQRDALAGLWLAHVSPGAARDGLTAEEIAKADAHIASQREVERVDGIARMRAMAGAFMLNAGMAVAADPRVPLSTPAEVEKAGLARVEIGAPETMPNARSARESNTPEWAESPSAGDLT